MPGGVRENFEKYLKEEIEKYVDDNDNEKSDLISGKFKNAKIKEVLRKINFRKWKK